MFVVHPECMVGGLRLRRGMIFAPDSIDDAISARSLTERVAHDASIAPAEGSVIGSLEPCGFEPPRVDQPLPGLSFFRALEWSDLRRLPGDTYVQIPLRLEQCLSDAIGVATNEIERLGPETAEALPAWKAFLILPWMLLYRPPEAIDGESCATLLSERLDRFWQGDVAAMYR